MNLFNEIDFEPLLPILSKYYAPPKYSILSYNDILLHKRNATSMFGTHEIRIRIKDLFEDPDRQSAVHDKPPSSFQYRNMTKIINSGMRSIQFIYNGGYLGLCPNVNYFEWYAQEGLFAQ